MNILIGNSSKYFFPFFTLNSAYYSEYLALLFVFIHIMLTILCILLTIQTCVIVKTVHVFHPNMSNIITAIIVQWFETLIAKLIIFPYQLGFLTVGEDRVFQSWVTNTVSEMPQIEKPGDIVPLFVSGILYLHYAFTVAFSVFILTCERAFATFFITDYEKKPRAYICVILLLMAHLLTFLLSCLATCELITFTTGIAISGVIIVGAVLIYFIILHINIGIQKRLDKNDHKQDYYSLAIRFQAKENARSLELAKKVVVVAAAAVLLGMALLVMAAFHWIDNYISTIVTFAEAVFNLNPLVVVPVGLYSVPIWRDRFFRKLPFLEKIRTVSTMRIVKVSAAKENEEVKQTEVYFNQLSEAWK
ncbi:unnamed protein product [Caenorhabditis sp. 36 PRJEB53466]|nr:unnamed protein product [Caenorhabditis sp. 36 PRJEB53466]